MLRIVMNMNEFIISYSKNRNIVVSSYCSTTSSPKTSSRLGAGRLTKAKLEEQANKVLKNLELDDKPWNYAYDLKSDNESFISGYSEYTEPQLNRIISAVKEKIDNHPIVQQYKNDPLSLVTTYNSYEEAYAKSQFGKQRISYIQIDLDRMHSNLEDLGDFDLPINSSSDIDRLRTNKTKCEVISEQRSSEFPTWQSVYEKFKSNFSGMQDIYEEETGVSNPPGLKGTTSW